MSTIGWDIGGVNTKVVRVAGDQVLSVRSRPFELQRDPGALVQVLRNLATEVGASSGGVHAVTMTAELSQTFRTKREGVSFVLQSVEAAFPSCAISVYAVATAMRFAIAVFKPSTSPVLCVVAGSQVAFYTRSTRS